MTNSELSKELENLKSDIEVIIVTSEIIENALCNSGYDERYAKSVSIITKLLGEHKGKLQDIIDNNISKD